MSEPTALPTIALPGVDVPMTTAVLGTMSFGDTADESATAAVFEAAMSAGITGVDTANGYAKGTTEGLIAPLVKRYRDRIVLATKAGMPHPDAGENSPLSAAGLRASVEGSLRRLRVDVIDLFYLHQPDRSADLDETLSTVAQLQDEGKIRALGVSNYSAWLVGDVAATAARVGASAPVVAQNVYNMLARRIEDEWAEFARTHHVLTMCYNPLAGGLLAAPPDPSGQAPSRFSTSVLADMYKQRYWTPELLVAVQELAAVSTRAGLSLPELAMRWVISQPVTDAVLLGGGKTGHLLANLRAIDDGPLPQDVLQECERVIAPLRGPMPMYTR